MATKFLARPLQVLDRVYRFLEGQAPQLVELAQPIQVVHDVSRESELGSPAMGFFLSGQDVSHGAANTQEASWDPYTEVAYLYPGYSDTWVWLCHLWATGSTAAISSANGATLSIGLAPYGEAFPRRDIPLIWWNTAAAIFDQNVAPATHPWGMMQAAARMPLSLPILVPPGATMRLSSTSTGVLVLRAEGLFWAGPMGTRPPGLS